MVFKVKLQDGTLVDVPDKVELNVQGLRIIGDDTPDWNEPIQQNLMVLSNEIKDLEATVAAIDTTGTGSVDLSGYYLKTEIGTVAEFTAALG